MARHGNQLEEIARGSVRKYRIGVLLYFRDEAGRVLLIQRRRAPNVGLWCAVGGKLEMDDGESPYECAQREGAEEVGAELAASDLDLRCVMAEKDYAGTGHWLMFIFLVKKALVALPAEIEEGAFSFFEEGAFSKLEMPALDRRVLRERILNPDAEKLHWLRVDSGEGVIEEELLG